MNLITLDLGLKRRGLLTVLDVSAGEVSIMTSWKGIRITFLALSIVLLALSCATSRPADREADAKQLLALHEDGLRAHRESDVDRLLAHSEEEFVVANRGSISHPTLKERRERFSSYLGSTRFSIYRDQVPPIVKVSADGSLGWVIAQVEAKGIQTTSSGTTEPLEFVSAWIELYEKRGGRWRAVGNVSNFKP